MTNLAIIPARGGSKRIPRKNIKLFLGKPIIAYSIETALKSNLFKEVMVSTDDREIAEIAIKYGANVPFMRSKKTANDHATIAEVVIEILDHYSKLDKKFDKICCLFSTAPFITEKRIKEGLSLMEKMYYDAVFPIQKFSYPIWRSLKIENGKLRLNWPKYLNSRSQDLPEAYHDAGQFYWANIEAFLKNKTFMMENCGGLELSSLESVDIDTENDWKFAEKIYQI